LRRARPPGRADANFAQFPNKNVKFRAARHASAVGVDLDYTRGIRRSRSITSNSKV
jgi:hypothetical protein